MAESIKKTDLAANDVLANLIPTQAQIDMINKADEATARWAATVKNSLVNDKSSLASLQKQAELQAQLNAITKEKISTENQRLVLEQKLATQVKLISDANERDSIKWREKTSDMNENAVALVLQTKELKKIQEALKAVGAESDQLIKYGARTAENTAKVDALSKKMIELKFREAGLKQSISDVNIIMRTQAKEVNAVKGSMISMNSELGQMRSLYRELSDEERSSPFGVQLQKQIVFLDKDLKNLDNSIGNNQRNVGNYKSAFNAVTGLMGDFGTKLNTVATQFSAVFSPEMVKTIKSLSSSTKLLAASTAIYNLVIGTSTGLMKLFRIAMISTGVGALVVGIGLLVANFDKVKAVVQDVVDWFKNLGEHVIRLIEWYNELGVVGKVMGYLLAAPVMIALEAYQFFFGEVKQGTADMMKADREAAAAKREQHNEWGRQLKAELKGLKDKRKAEAEAHTARQSQYDLEIERMEALGQSSHLLKLAKIQDLQDELKAQIKNVVDSISLWEGYYDRLRMERGQTREEFIASMKKQGVDLEKMLNQYKDVIKKLEDKVYSSESKIIDLKTTNGENNNEKPKKDNKLIDELNEYKKKKALELFEYENWLIDNKHSREKIDAWLADKELEDAREIGKKIIELGLENDAVMIEHRNNYLKKVEKLNLEHRKTTSDQDEKEKAKEKEEKAKDLAAFVKDLTAKEKKRLEAEKKRLEAEKKREEELAELRKEGFKQVVAAADALFDKNIEKLNKEKDAATKQQDYLQDLAASGNITAKESLKAEIEAQREAEKEIMEMERKKATLKLVTTGLSTFNSEINSGKSPGEAFASTLISIEALKTVLSGMNFFAKGTDNAPKGMAVVDELGAEIHLDRAGNIKSFGSDSGANLRQLDRGDKIITADKSKNILNYISKIEQPNKKGAASLGGNNFEMIKELKNINSTIKNQTSSTEFDSVFMEIVRSTTNNGVRIKSRYRS